jgi:hypothetical protein
MSTNRAGERREACGQADPPAERWLEAHERWTYDEPTKVQTLRRLICLCNQFHTLTHFGLVQIKDHADEARAHLRTVTGMTAQQAKTTAATHSRCGGSGRPRVALDLNVCTTTGVTLAPRQVPQTVSTSPSTPPRPHHPILTRRAVRAPALHAHWENRLWIPR